MIYSLAMISQNLLTTATDWGCRTTCAKNIYLRGVEGSMFRPVTALDGITKYGYNQPRLHKQEVIEVHGNAIRRNYWKVDKYYSYQLQ